MPCQSPCRSVQLLVRRSIRQVFLKHHKNRKLNTKHQETHRIAFIINDSWSFLLPHPPHQPPLTLIISYYLLALYPLFTFEPLSIITRSQSTLASGFIYFDASFFRCVHASLYEALSVRPWSVGPSGVSQISRKWRLQDNKTSGNSKKWIFKCVHASLYEALSVRPSVCPSVRPSVGPLVRRFSNNADIETLGQ